MTFTPHDLIWIAAAEAIEGDLPDWVTSQWRRALPLVVRRDSDDHGRIPVGVRGLRRDQRAAGWVAPQHILRRLPPEALSETERLLASPFVSQQPVQAAIQLAQQRWWWPWGITGSVGYALATEVPVLHDSSDLDLLIRCPLPVAELELRRWQQFTRQLPCRVDTQIEVPAGAFALNEWLRDGRVLLKTNTGPRITTQPWSEIP
ncbi:malonate decarboxylase holo-ACP synthase [Erwinia sorbitola]|uniref:Malonate decarboxylase holo-ACP synthase n=1 Tax=Erwinia sorbitola TaxID=2681984 RepID=A0A6I6E980_9GAMM|nr:malonate decarboxylase holo-ACP synthase [Erwinia sorbitola]MTD27708.1 malonate decarboxylase holo-ACP synthase [Erwinia sorbitola]QGU86287.1 malonate decarboxylase holo-ACP synthase [Erwinia sorbitola]